MYSVVLMVAATSGGDVASFGRDKGGCNGCSGYTAGCSGCDGGGFLGMRHGGGLFKHKDKGGCTGSSYAAGCTGSSYAAGCTGVVYAAPVVAAPVAPAMPAAPIVAHPAPTGCTGSYYTPVTVSSGCHGCSGGGFLGMRSGGGLFKHHKSKGCSGGCGGCW